MHISGFMLCLFLPLPEITLPVSFVYNDSPGEAGWFGGDGHQSLGPHGEEEHVFQQTLMG